MSKAGHTPGPWALGDENDAAAEVVIGKTIVVFDRVCALRGEPDEGKYCISREEMLANAHLAMAAPDMLAALRAAAHEMRSFMPTTAGETLTLVEAAIAKAEGGGA